MLVDGLPTFLHHVANAIRDATGADVRSLPISREEMLRALAEERERRGAAAAV